MLSVALPRPLKFGCQSRVWHFVQSSCFQTLAQMFRLFLSYCVALSINIPSLAVPSLIRKKKRPHTMIASKLSSLWVTLVETRDEVGHTISKLVNIVQGISGLSKQRNPGPLGSRRAKPFSTTRTGRTDEAWHFVHRGSASDPERQFLNMKATK